ncbi:MAG: ABC transporter permease subunit [Chloroflexota bacterium]
MLSNIFLKTLRDQRNSLRWWSIGIVLYAGFIVGLYPAFEDALLDIVESYPEDIAKFLGLEDTSEFATPAGFLNAELFGVMMPILFIVFAVASGSGAIAGEEESGTMETLLSEPVTRRRLALEKFASMLVTTAGLALVLWVTVAVGSFIVGMDVGLVYVAAATASLTLLGIVFGSLAFAIGSITGRRGRSVGVSAGAAIVTYLLDVVSRIVEVLEPAKWASPFFYYNGHNPLANGLNFWHTAVLLGTIMLTGIAALVSFQRRDVRL